MWLAAATAISWNCLFVAVCCAAQADAGATHIGSTALDCVQAATLKNTAKYVGFNPHISLVAPSWLMPRWRPDAAIPRLAAAYTVRRGIPRPLLQRQLGNCCGQRRHQVSLLLTLAPRRLSRVA